METLRRSFAKLDLSFLNSDGFLAFLGVSLILMTIFIWGAQLSNNLTPIYANTEAKARSYASETEIRYSNIHEALKRLASRGIPVDESDQIEWEKDAAFYINTFDGLQSIAWVDSEFQIRQMAPVQKNRSYIGQPPSQVNSGPSSLNLWLPIKDEQELHGFILGTIQVEDFIAPVLQEIGDDYMLHLSHEGLTVYSSPNWQKTQDEFEAKRTITFENSTVLNLTLAPTQRSVNSGIASARNLLFTSLVFCLITILAVYYAQNYYRAASTSRMRYRNLFQASQDAIFVMASEGKILEANQAATSMLGYSREELIQQNLSDLQAPAQAGGEEKPISAWQEGGALELGFVHQNGHVIPVDLMVSPIEEGEEQGLLLGISRDITERKQSEYELRQALHRTELLIRELYHRTKNNMQVINSMLMLQSSYIDDPQVLKIFQDTQNRIQSMALVHEKLYQSQNLSRIHLDDYIRSLTALLMKSYQVTGQRIQVDYDLEEVPTLIDIAVPCGLILNELLANALEHAFPGERRGKIMIALKRANTHQISLFIADNGVGLPGDFDFRQTETFGLQAVTAIAEHQLLGTIHFENQHGVRWQLDFRDDLYRERV